MTTHAPPTPTEFTQITVKTAVGFLIMGFIGFFVKLLFIVSRSPVLVPPAAPRPPGLRGPTAAPPPPPPLKSQH
jgi:hypothetical protein